jgi:hypothetical protein
VYLNVFNHIVTLKKELHEFLHMMSAISILGENSFIFYFCGLWIGDKITWGAGAHLKRRERKKNVKR